MIRNTILLEVICTDFLTPITTPNLYLSPLRLLLHVFEVLLLKHFLLQDVCCLLPVSLLHSIFLNEHTQSSGNMCRSTCALRLVDMLTTGTLCPHKVISYFFFAEDEVEWDSWHDSNSYG